MHDNCGSKPRPELARVNERACLDLTPEFIQSAMRFNERKGNGNQQGPAYSEAPIIVALKQVQEGAHGRGRCSGFSKHTVYVWKATYAAMDLSEAEEAGQQLDENARLNKLVADRSLDTDMLLSVS